MCLSSARGTESRTTSMTSRARSQGWRAMPTPLPSAWASASNWLTVCVAPILDPPLCFTHAAAFGMGQRQQLVDGVRGADAGAADLLQRAPDLLGAGAFALGQIGLHA